MASFSEGARERLTGLLDDHGLPGASAIADFRDVPDAPRAGGGCYLAVWPLEAGFEAEWRGGR